MIGCTLRRRLAIEKFISVRAFVKQTVPRALPSTPLASIEIHAFAEMPISCLQPRTRNGSVMMTPIQCSWKTRTLASKTVESFTLQ